MNLSPHLERRIGIWVVVAGFVVIFLTNATEGGLIPGPQIPAGVGGGFIGLGIGCILHARLRRNGDL